MWIKILSYITVIGSSMLKMILGPGLALAFKLSFVESVLLTTLGMMLTIVLFTSFLGKLVRRWFIDTFFKNKKVFTKNTRRMVRIWTSYGLIGTAFLTPLLLSPIGGGLVVNTFGGKKIKIYTFMLISGLVWSTIYTYIFYAGNDLIH
jgi:hypothetical protein